MESAMISKKFILAAALFGTLTLGWSSAAVAQNAQAEVRQALRNTCQVESGKQKGTCMRETARTMRDLTEMALAAYKQCIRDGYEYSDCQQIRQDYLWSGLEY
jgi:hypothetical protein